MSLLAMVEAMDSYEAPLDGLGDLAAFFGQEGLDDISDIDREEVLELSYLVSLNPNKIAFSSPDLDELLQTEDAYFLDVSISREKALTYALFCKYPQEGGGQELILSERPFLPEQAYALDRFQAFAKANGYLVLTSRDLVEKVEEDGEVMTLYAKYFNRLADNDMTAGWERLAKEEEKRRQACKHQDNGI